MEKSLNGKNLHVTLLGHSFIRRLNRFMNSCDKFDNLRLLKSNFLINCRAQGGLTVARLPQQKQLCTFSYHPHIIFLQIGGNDAANRRTNAYQIAQDIFAKHDENAISLWHHRGFWDNLDFLCFDGVHLNHFGMRKYFESVRSAVLHTSNHPNSIPQTAWRCLPKRGKSGQSEHSTNKKQKTNIDYTKLAAEIIRLQSGNINIPPSNNSTIIQADIHADTGTDHTRIIPTSPLSQNIDLVVNTVPTPIPSLAASEVRSRASQIQENPPCTVALEDSADHNPSCSEPPVNHNTSMSSENSLRIQVSDGIPLGATISQKVKEKIWSDEFIDMNSLTSSYVEDPFSLFVNIYIEKCPEEARHLLKYGHNIREMYDLYGDEPWRIYDEKFRRLRETIKLPWGKLIDELYTKSANTSNTQNKNFRAQPARQNKTYQNQGNTQYYSKNMHPNNVKLLEEELQGYDIDLSNMLVQGFKFGFSLNFQGTPGNKTCKNHKSATENPDAVLGELVVRTKQCTGRVLQRQDVLFTWEKGILKGVELTLIFFKNNKTNKPVTIFLSALPNSPRICPVNTLYAFVNTLKHKRGPSFQHTNGQYVSAHFVTEQMKKLITFIGLNPTQYKGHSFRIGAATNAASLGYSEQ
ncbi:unnamed protein product [Mytilus coruscus]|uniref:Tyr recombinase domain-containing protein n=1 Tax=Mytilus coruscus TaxID=42192 RepID=A0A6J8BAE2_MYTCO|nr:unnamed protein product [Mytilus coruscus]